ncbi:Guanosine nucleotide diphosphate dissociation inhibitor 2 [Zea mays]|uniref:Guanosine nucleotide diphosphate dissociation inhibitor 2 n=1 Tax=Zea mays TaxID=4577 RepID=A0A1D6G4K1_MAIZE|nr:Guanosine nucleotide diphosphate dissociation inhibitor 2 [Zea mays]
MAVEEEAEEDALSGIVLRKYVKQRLLGGFTAQRTTAMGRRKTAITRFVLQEGTDKVFINFHDAKVPINPRIARTYYTNVAPLCCLGRIAIGNSMFHVYFRKYGLSDDTVDFVGHALALHRDDRYLDEPALDTVNRIKLYADSLARFQGGSPYIYPLYGLGELPQGFARLSAVYGGTYMLNKPDCKVEFDMEGKVCGVTSEGENAKCKKVVCDPSYLQNKVRKIGRVVRAIAIMSHPIPNTNESHSITMLDTVMIFLSLSRYVFCCSYTHNVAPRGKLNIFVSAEAETDNPQSELKPGIDLLGSVDEIFYDIYDRYEPVNEPSLDNCFVSTSYDATTHFETTVTDVLNMYTMITGKVTWTSSFYLLE